MQNSEPVRSDQRFRVVGIGASAGGLEALLELFGALPANTGIAFAVVQHLEPHHESQLAVILSRATQMPVVQAQEGQSLERDHVYVIPPNVVMVVEQGVLHLAPRPTSARPHYPIDTFLESLAADKGPDAIGIVLSGSASDGAQGIRVIKAAGGTTFSQDERSAKYGGMPHSAIATGAIDFILPPQGIAQELVKVDSHPFLTAPLQQLEEPVEGSEENGDLAAILERLKVATQVDFTAYKLSTIRRRVGRRLVVNHLGTLREYRDYLDAHPGEVHELYRDILISVTSFFREPLMYEALSKVMLEYLMTRNDEGAFRIWVPGCATGEEAYSLAMVALEICKKSGKDYPLQIFGTDISESAIERARSGTYTEKVAADIPEERLERFFTRVDSGFRIKREVRDCCIFALHDLTSDPPFSQMDMVSCRNVFIYLSAALQQRVLPALHYSLKPSGLLVLGSAETVGNRSDLFGIANHEHKIYSKRPGPAGLTMELRASHHGKDVPAPSLMNSPGMRTPAPADLEARSARILRDLYAPAGVLINDGMQILHFHGQTGFYLEPVSQDAGANLLRVAREELVMPIRKAVASALAQKQPVNETGIQVRNNGQSREVNVRVVPLSDESRACLVLFEDQVNRGQGTAAQAGGHDPGAAALELGIVQRELDQTKDYLRKIIEQHDAITEELRAANEEVRSSNEELQSTNEELRTAKEQLQSANEELTTVNDELQHRNKDLSLASNDLSNILSATTIPILMVGLDLRLRRFTPAAERLLGLIATDIGRKITDIHFTIQVADLGDWLQETLRDLSLQLRKVQDREGRRFDLYIRPYRTIDERIDGAVLTFIDVDDVTRALEAAEEARQYADGIVETVQHPLLILDSDLRVKRATRAFYSTFGVRPEETLERTIDDLGEGQWNIPELRRLLEQALIRDLPFRDFEVTHEFPQIGRRIMRLNARRLTDASRTVLLLAIEDVTDRQESAEIQYRRLFESAKDGIVVLNSPSGTVMDVNPYFLELSRYSMADLLNKPFREIPPFLEDEKTRRLVPETIEKGATRYDSVRLCGRDGRELTVDIVANNYRVKEQSFIQVNIRDVTERRRDEDRLRHANLDLQQFAFAASHDLQEPLRTITSYLELLKGDFQGKLGADADQYIGFILAAVDRMRQLVLDLLGYSQVVRADLKVALVTVEAALSSALMNLQLAIQSSEARITFDSLPAVYMDETQLVQLLQNLIGNSIKYRGAEPPRIHISAREAGAEWIFSVRDNGVGIDMRYAGQIFAVFKRLHGASHPGTGIGLGICKKIVERRGGRIWVESEVGKGSTFYFTVPNLPKQE
ncbi:MAG: PAS domain S-box protein [Acidobacteriia bacterium]|nr:PAS domain S-box protein [Terriglobia bacterium]